MMKLVIAYAGTAVTLAILDAIWLTMVGGKLYRPALGDLLTDGFRLAPAIVFYVLFVLGVVIFAVHPALVSGRWSQAMIMGGLFGFFCYATYDLTNQATLRVWPVHLTLIDLAWGTFLAGTSAFVGWLMATRFG